MGPRAAQTAVLEEVDVKTCPLVANGALDTLWREMLQALIRRRNDPFVRPFQMMILVRAAERAKVFDMEGLLLLATTAVRVEVW